MHVCTDAVTTGAQRIQRDTGSRSTALSCLISDSLGTFCHVLELSEGRGGERREGEGRGGKGRGEEGRGGERREGEGRGGKGRGDLIHWLHTLCSQQRGGGESRETLVVEKTVLHLHKG